MASWDCARRLLKHPEYFVGTLTEKMLTYALGRPLEYYDMPVVRGIVEGAAAQRLSFFVVNYGDREERAF